MICNFKSGISKKTIIKSIFSFSLPGLVVISSLFSCSENSTGLTNNRPDTTSHNFTVERFEFGTQNYSIFHDIVIISPDNIWAVGEILTEEVYTEDSLGNYIQPYNATHWNGINWELKRIPSRTVISGEIYYPQMYTVFCLNKDSIFFSNGGILIKYFNNEFSFDVSMYTMLQGGIKKIWASSANNLFMVGTNGTIVHYNGQNWSVLNSGTDMWVMDIWGKYNDKTKQYDIYCPVTLPLKKGEPDLLRINPDLTVNSENWPRINELYSVWFERPDKIFVAGGGVYTYDGKGNYSERFKGIPTTLLSHIRGNAENDIYISGHFGLLMHYNGSTWKGYTEFDEADHLPGLDVKNDLIVAAGEDYPKAVIYMLRR